jgi:uncharacterized protein (TIGR02599 family)
MRRLKTTGTSRVAGPPAFTLIEVLLSVTILAVIMVSTTLMLDSSLGQLRIAESRVGQFRDAQAAFESMSLRLAGCDISPYYDYEFQNQNRDTVPIGYELQSDLHLVSGPAKRGVQPLFASGAYSGHAIFFHGTYGRTEERTWKGLGNLLNGWGYFVEFGDDRAARAAFLNGEGNAPPRYRFRLKELQVPAEQVGTYAAKLSTESAKDKIFAWFRGGATQPEHVSAVAENIVTLVVMPLVPPGSKDVNGSSLNPHALAPAYYYDTRNYQHAKTPQAELTRHRLPPILRFTLVAVDEVSAQRLQERHGASEPDLGLDALFVDASKYDQDIHALEDALERQEMNYRVFTTTVRLRNARWTGTY